MILAMFLVGLFAGFCLGVLAIALVFIGSGE